MMGWWINSKGYYEGRVERAGRFVCIKQHRWIMEQHLGRRLATSEIVHHINGDRRDNRIENLQLMTRAEHALEHGDLPCNAGESHGRAKLTESQVAEIRRVATRGTYSQLGREYGVCNQTIQRIAAGKRWIAKAAA